MGSTGRARTQRRLGVAGALLVGIALVGCSDDDDGGAAPTTNGASTTAAATTTEAAETTEVSDDTTESSAPAGSPVGGTDVPPEVAEAIEERAGQGAVHGTRRGA